MSIEKFLNLMRIQASLVSNGKASTALGTVIAYDQNNYYVNCQLYPADPNDPTSQPMTTGWIPLFSPWVGNGWGFFAPPNIGDVIEIHFQEGSFQNAYAGMRCFQLGQNLSVPSGECWLVHQTGSYIKFKATGEIDIFSAGTTPINVTATTVNISGAVNLGNLSSSLTGFLNGAAMTIYNSHTHAVTTAPGTTGVPNQQMTSSDLSTNVLGN